jgi:hypothetical protein
MTLLLLLATSFACFVPAIETSSASRLLDIASYQLGADFGGSMKVLPESGIDGLIKRTNAYQAIPGVLSASVYYHTQEFAVQRSSDAAPNPFQNPLLEIAAIDPNTFAQTITWPKNINKQSFSEIASQLRANRNGSIDRGEVYAIVDEATWTLLDLSPGKSFTLPLLGYPLSGGMHFIATAKVTQIPTIFSSANNFRGGILVDFENFATIYRKDTGRTVAANRVWLHTKDDDVSLASVRKSIQEGSLQLQQSSGSGSYVDRRELILSLQTDPMRVVLIGSLIIGAMMALGLSLIGVITMAIIRIREQTMPLTLLHSLGVKLRQLRQIVFWEQGIVYFTALVIGGLLSLLLIAVVTSPLVSLMFTGMGYGQFNQSIGNAIPIQLTWPWLAIALLLSVLGLIGIIVITIFGWIVPRSSQNQILRLNED